MTKTASNIRRDSPNGINATDLTIFTHTNNIILSNDTISYTFGTGLDITHGFFIAYAPWCANDVIGGGAAAPEPATMLLFGTGLIGLAGIARRRSKQK